MGWYHDNSGEQTQPVGGKQPNQFGLHDMHGNVHEWCEDVYDATFYSKDVPGIDPVSTTGSERRLMRGGSYNADPRYCRSASRLGPTPDLRLLSLGFRPAVPSP